MNCLIRCPLTPLLVTSLHCFCSNRNKMCPWSPLWYCRVFKKKRIKTVLVSAWSGSLHRSIELDRDSVPKASNRQVWFFFCFCHFGSNGNFMLHTTSSAAIVAQMVCFLKSPLCVSRIQFTCCRTAQKCVIWLISHFRCHSPQSVWFDVFYTCTEEKASLISACFIRQVHKSVPPILIQNSRKRKK